MSTPRRKTVKLSIWVDENLLELMKQYKVTPYRAKPAFEKQVKKLIRKNATKMGQPDPFNQSRGRLLGGKSVRKGAPVANVSNW